MATLDPTTPVTAEDLQKLQQLDIAKKDLALAILDLELERVRLLSAANRIEQQKARIFEEIFTSRGLDPTSVVHVDTETGEIRIEDMSPADAVSEAPLA